MFEDRPNKDIIERAENLIIRLREVQSCRIYTDESGTITEIHVVAVTDRAPKLLARDVETCLKASLGIIVDYRKIGVVVIDTDKNTIAQVKAGAGFGDTSVTDAPVDLGSGHMAEIGCAAAGDEDDFPVIDLEELIDTKFGGPPGRSGPPGPEITLHTDMPHPPREAAQRDERAGSGDERIERGEERARRSGDRAVRSDDPLPESPERPSRIAFKGLRVSLEDSRVDVEVRLARGPLVVTGSQGDYRFNGKLPETIAGATLHAISELLDEDIHLCLARAEKVVLDGRVALCAVVNAIRERSVTSYVGCAFIGADPNEYAVLAILDALNRPLGAWKLRTDIHYTIR
jgi:hypothetical protein